ncbi:MAG: hypothetical protein KDB02_02745 [Acidimicrobiales bacterium]|nr:hypothetical protein [Acidimicrobiales bacterium]
MRLEDLAGRKVALLGLGADVLAAAPAVAASGPDDIAVVDDGPAAEATDLPVLTLAEAGAWADVFVRSPGFPRYQQPLTDALARGAEMTTPVDLWMGTHGEGRTVVMISGTKGKSTVTALLGTLAERGGFDVGVAGNLGVPVFCDGWNHEASLVILEVSSYQAADLHHVPDVAVLTYLSEDHLTWHGGVGRYVADKLRIVRNEAGTAPRVFIPAEGGRAASALEALGIEPTVVTPPEADPTVPVHRLQNAALAGAVLAALGGAELVDVEIVAAARHAMPGRLDPCPGPEGLLCVDDALASNPSATAAALAWLRGLDRPTVVLLGGVDRSVDPSPLAEEAARWPEGLLSAVVLPDNGPALAARCGIPAITKVDEVSEATTVAVQNVGEGGAVLLSPAAPTPPAVGNWETRSNQFREALAEAAR